MSNNKIAPIHNFSAAGEAKLESMAGNVFIYEEFLRYQGRIFKQPVSVGLEFYTQRPNARFIGNTLSHRAKQQYVSLTIKEFSMIITTCLRPIRKDHRKSGQWIKLTLNLCGKSWSFLKKET